MYYIVETDKSFAQASKDLESAVVVHGFGIMHVHDLGAALRGKGFAFDEECKVFEGLQSGAGRKAPIHRYAAQHGAAVSHLGVHGQGQNEDRPYQAGANAHRAVSGCGVDSSCQRGSGKGHPDG